jgi:hypothetical protein
MNMDIVKRLRATAGKCSCDGSCMGDEAADEIGRLRGLVREAMAIMPDGGSWEIEWYERAKEAVPPGAWPIES